MCLSNLVQLDLYMVEFTLRTVERLLQFIYYLTQLVFLSLYLNDPVLVMIPLVTKSLVLSVQVCDHSLQLLQLKGPSSLLDTLVDLLGL